MRSKSSEESREREVGEQRGKLIGGVCTELGNSTRLFSKSEGDTVESLNNVT